MINFTPESLLEQERIAYHDGNVELAELLDCVATTMSISNNEPDSIDNALDLLGLSGKRGYTLYSATENISKKLDAIDEFMHKISLINRLPKELKLAIMEFKESF